MNKKIGKIFENIIYYLLLIPIVIVTIHISFQAIFFKDKIPDIFGYKFFFVFDDNMDKSVKKGDLVITYDKDVKEINKNDVIAFRNNMNTVTIHRINDIQEKNESDIDNSEITFIMNTSQNEIIENKNIVGKQIEGVVVKRIPNIGGFLYVISRPIAILTISCIILLSGGIWIYIAGILDKKEEMKIIQEQNQKDMKKEEQKQSISV